MEKFIETMKDLIIFLPALPLAIASAKQLWTFHFDYLKSFKLRALKSEVKEVCEDLPDTKILLKRRYAEEVSGIFLGKRLSVRQQSIVKKKIDDYSIPLSLLSSAWNYVNIDINSEELTVNFTKHDNIARIYFLTVIPLGLVLVLASLMSQILGENQLEFSWGNMAIFTLMLFISIHRVRGHIAGHRLSKHMQSLSKR